MEYESRTLKWYWIACLLIYSAGAVYFLLKENPFLYSQSTLTSNQSARTAADLKPWPLPDDQFPLEKKPSGHQSPWPFLENGNSNTTSAEITRNKSYNEFKTYALTPQPQKSFKILGQTSKGLVLSDSQNLISRYDLKGQRIWTYGLPVDAEISQTLQDNVFLYVVQKNGSLTAVHLESGRPHWNLDSHSAAFGECWIQGSYLVFPIERREEDLSKKSKAKKTSNLIFINRENGTVAQVIEGFEFKDPFKTMALPGLDLRVIYSGNQVLAIPKNAEKTNVLWSTKLPENILHHLTSAANGQIFAVTEGHRLYVLNAKKKGEVLFDLDLDIRPGGDPTYLPEMERLAYLSEGGTLRVIDMQKHEMAWKYDLSIKGELRGLWSARLKGAYIQEFGMKWAHKGWTFWSPCRSNHFCVYNPDRGQLVQRIELSGSPVIMPVVEEDRIYALIRLSNGNELAMAHLLEPAEFRKAELQEQKAQDR